ncbi:MAG: hypothetical protein PHW75_01950 [Patescibacteria group bacterium]|nr:hypothetical protein [Patescibacteria group bacterium]
MPVSTPSPQTPEAERPDSDQLEIKTGDTLGPSDEALKSLQTAEGSEQSEWLPKKGDEYKSPVGQKTVNDGDYRPDMQSNVTSPELDDPVRKSTTPLEPLTGRGIPKDASSITNPNQKGLEAKVATEDSGVESFESIDSDYTASKETSPKKEPEDDLDFEWTNTKDRTSTPRIKKPGVSEEALKPYPKTPLEDALGKKYHPEEPEDIAEAAFNELEENLPETQEKLDKIIGTNEAKESFVSIEDEIKSAEEKITEHITEIARLKEKVASRIENLKNNQDNKKSATETQLENLRAQLGVKEAELKEIETDPEYQEKIDKLNASMSRLDEMEQLLRFRMPKRDNPSSESLDSQSA